MMQHSWGLTDPDGLRADTGSPLAALQTLGDLLRYRASIVPEEVAYRFLDDRGCEIASATYSELDAAAQRISAALVSRVRAGANVLLLYEPGLEFICALFGCFYADMVAIPCHPPGPAVHATATKRLQAIAADALPQAVLTDSGCLSEGGDACARLPELCHVPWIASDQLDREAASDDQPIWVAADAVALLQYSSGSTSAPSGVVLSHRNILTNQEMIRSVFGHDERSIVVSWLPLHHDMGLIGGVLQPLYMGIPCILMSPQTFLKSPWIWLEAIGRYRATTSGGPNFAYDLCVRRVRPQRRERLDLTSWQVAFNGSEPVRAATLAAFAETFSECGFRRQSFLPCYGLAEATLLVSGGPAEGSRPTRRDPRQAAPSRADAGPEQSLVGCGAVAPGLTLRIVDPDTREPVAAGETGEIWVCGANVAHGYWGRAGRTRTTFRNAIPGEPGTFMRTGDLGFLQDGQLFIAGRLSDVIVLRGRKHYPEDLEATVEASNPAFRPAGCIAFGETVDGVEGLVVIQELAARSAPQSRELIACIQGALTEEHGIKADEIVLVPLRTLPRTSSGKRQRSACRSLWRSGELITIPTSLPAMPAEADARSVDALAPDRPAPDTPLARSGNLIAARAAGLLGIAPCEIDRSRALAAYGLDSIAFMQLMHMIEGEFGVCLDIRIVLRAVSVDQLSAMVYAASTAESRRPAIASPDASFALSSGQRALLFASKASTRPDLFNAAVAVRFGSEVQLAELRWAVARVVEAHGMLRSRIVVREGTPRAEVSEAATVPFEHVNARSWSPGQLADELRSQASLAFDLEGGPLARIRAYAGADERVVVLFVAHHAICDLRSLEIFLDDLARYCDAWRCGALDAPQREAAGYGAYVEAQRIWLDGDEARKSWLYWQRQLKDCPSLRLWHDRARPATETHRGAHVPLAFGAASSLEIEAAARSSGVTPFSILLAAFVAFLARLSGQRDIAVGTPATDRLDSRFSRTFGNFVNLLVIRAEIDPEDSFSSVVRQVARCVEEALAHRSIPFADLVERLNPPREAGRQPLYQAMFVLQQTWEPESEALGFLALDQAGPAVRMKSLEFEPLQIDRGVSQVDLTLTMVKISDSYRGTLEYNRDLFDEASIEDLALRFVATTSRFCAEPGRRTGSTPPLGEFERDMLLQRSEDGDRTDTATVCLHERFRRWSSLTPDVPAVVTEAETLTYGEVDARSDRIARALAGRGIGLGSRVAFCLTPSSRVVTAMLGILKAGAAYVALDPSDPPDRLRFFVEDSGSRLVITDTVSSIRLPGVAADLVEHDVLEREAASERAYRCGAIPPAAPAYLIYTSGSSGTPKGAIISHANVDRLFEATSPWLEFDASDVWTLFHSPAFDFSVWEIWGALRHGGRLVVLPHPVTRSPSSLRDCLVTHRVTVLNQTPSAFAQLARDVAANREAEFHLRYIILGGEALDLRDAGRWIEARGDQRPLIVTMYGITETTVHLTHRRIRRSDVDDPASPIGSAIADIRLYILDDDLEPVPSGLPGEIFVAGPGLGHGYHDRPALTAERFLPNPHAKRPGERLYRTGDTALRRATGELVFCGRRDSQVKVRGFRVELKEIEAALRHHAEVDQAIVLQHAGRTGRPELVAYVVGEPRPDLPTELRDHVRRFLPSHMVPSRFAWIGSIPLTRNGKLDVKALLSALLQDPEPTATGPGPSTDLQGRLLDLWADVLSVRRISIDDSFFDLGGHSLLLEEMAARLPELVGREVAILDLLRLPTVRALARFLEEDPPASTDAAALAQARAAARSRSTGPERLRRQSAQRQYTSQHRDDSG